MVDFAYNMKTNEMYIFICVCIFGLIKIYVNIFTLLVSCSTYLHDI